MTERERLQQELKTKMYDILVIGGGATGLGIALDAALRGLTVALVEAQDYASGPSSTSTKLLHGGVRYLEKAIKEWDWGQYKLVREALHERDTALQNNPTLGNPISLIIPVYSFWQKWYYKIGTFLYDFVASSTICPRAQWLSIAETWNRFPVKATHLQGALLYWDGQFNDAHYATALLLSATQAGVNALNYTSLTHWEGQTAQVQDAITQESYPIQARCLINCTGVQSDTIRQLIRPTEKKRLRPSKGIHIVINQSYLPTKTGMLVPKTEDGRVIFILPWLDVCLIGTTDTEQKDAISEPWVTETDVDYLLNQIRPYVSHDIKKEDILAVFAGNRPLVLQQKSKTEAIIRNHEMEIWEQEKVISVLGGKWTTYRQMAEEAVDAAQKMLQKPVTPCKTKHFPLTVPAYSFSDIFPNPQLLDRLQIWQAKDWLRRGTRLELRNRKKTIELLPEMTTLWATYYPELQHWQKQKTQEYKQWLEQYHWLDSKEKKQES